jgi:hypothetical protein
MHQLKVANAHRQSARFGDLVAVGLDGSTCDKLCRCDCPLSHVPTMTNYGPTKVTLAMLRSRDGLPVLVRTDTSSVVG